MNEPRQTRKRNRVTYTATPEGIDMTERALKRLGIESREAFAKSIYMSPTTFTKFFNREGIQLDSLQRICDTLKLDWRVVTGLNSEKQLFVSKIDDRKENELNVAKNISSMSRKVIVRDKDERTVKTTITLEGNLNSASNLNIFQAILKEYAGDSIEIEDIRQGSIKLFLSGSPEDIERLKTLIDSGELSELDGFPIQSIETIDDRNYERENTESNSKWKLVEDIVANSLPNRQLQRVDLSDVDLSGANLSRATLSEATLSEATLRGANLSRANLSEAFLSGATLSRANLRGATLSRANLRGATLSGANLSGADLSEATLSEATLSEATLSGANLSEANLSEANLSGADLSEATLRGANLSEANLSGANLSRATLRVATLYIANLSGANLSGANLSGATLYIANLSEATLSGANLSGADLRGAFLIEANLSEANLSEANLRGATLYKANLSGANLSGAFLSRANVNNAIFINAQGLSDEDRADLKRRGAIFGDRPPVPVPR